MNLPDPMNPLAIHPIEPVVAKKKRGFATMRPEHVREMARRGGMAAHRAGTAHEFTSVEAKAAGRKGGIAAHSASRAQAPDPSGPG